MQQWQAYNDQEEHIDFMISTQPTAQQLQSSRRRLVRAMRT